MLNRIKDVEKSVYDEFVNKVEDIYSGYVRKFKEIEFLFLMKIKMSLSFLSLDKFQMIDISAASKLEDLLKVLIIVQKDLKLFYQEQVIFF